MTGRRMTVILSGFGILLLILDAKTALLGASNAIELCLRSVIPCIFPFLVLSGLLVSAISGSRSGALAPLGRLLGIPKGSEGIFLTGILGGYPAGAQSIYNAWKQGHIRTEDAHRMLGFCSNAGPSFLFGILASVFPNMRVLWLLWGIHILSAVLTALILPDHGAGSEVSLRTGVLTVSQSLKASVATMGYICGWIILFRIMIAFCDRWILCLLPIEMRVAVYGALELANGCIGLTAIPSVGLRFMICGGMLAFGGLCVAMQTVTLTDRLGPGKYFPGKILQMLISVILCYFTQLWFFPAADRYIFSPKAVILLWLLLLIMVLWQRKIKLGVAFLR